MPKRVPLGWFLERCVGRVLFSNVLNCPSVLWIDSNVNTSTPAVPRAQDSWKAIGRKITLRESLWKLLLASGSIKLFMDAAFLERTDYPGGVGRSLENELFTWSSFTCPKTTCRHHASHLNLTPLQQGWLLDGT